MTHRSRKMRRQDPRLQARGAAPGRRLANGATLRVVVLENSGAARSWDSPSDPPVAVPSGLVAAWGRGFRRYWEGRTPAAEGPSRAR
jgi:hypothetical protein